MSNDPIVLNVSRYPRRQLGQLRRFLLRAALVVPLWLPVWVYDVCTRTSPRANLGRALCNAWYLPSGEWPA